MGIMKNTLLTAAAIIAMASGTAMAADMRPAPAPAPVYKAPMVPPFSWTGFYIGGNLGAAWTNTNITEANFGLTFNNGNNAVFVAGGQVGFNYQVGSVVFGVEGDFDWAANNNNTTVAVIGPLGHSFTASANDRWMATLAGRLGYAFDRWMIYAKGGGGWVGANGFTVTDITTGFTATPGNSSTVTGWLVGGGFEWAFANNWSFRAEYDYFGLSGRSFTIPGGVIPALGAAADTFNTGTSNIQMATVGINFRFGGMGY
jgi:outer membrane immunogenic protein